MNNKRFKPFFLKKVDHFNSRILNILILHLTAIICCFVLNNSVSTFKPEICSSSTSIVESRKNNGPLGRVAIVRVYLCSIVLCINK